MISYSKSSGFAYLWTLMLIAFLGVGLTLATHLYQTTVQRDKEVELLFIGRQFRTALARYMTSGPENAKNQYPATLEDLLKDPRFPNTVRHLRQLYRDPMTGKTEWGTVLVQGRVVGIHSLSDKKPLKQDNFEATDAGFRAKEKYSEWVFTYPSDLLVKGANNSDKPSAPPVGGNVPAAEDNLGRQSNLPPDANQSASKP